MRPQMNGLYFTGVWKGDGVRFVEHVDSPTFPRTVEERRELLLLADDLAWELWEAGETTDNLLDWHPFDGKHEVIPGIVGGIFCLCWKYFWYSAKQAEMLRLPKHNFHQNFDGSIYTTYEANQPIFINGKEFTEQTDGPKPSGCWDDYVQVAGPVVHQK